jgi:hypothetical protein
MAAGAQTMKIIEKFCYIAVLSNLPNERIGIVEFGKSGYHGTNLDTTYYSPADVEETVASLNGRLELPEDVVLSMKNGSMFGWHVPGAARAHEFFAKR